eukprot:3174744-Prymnesium_polylepis.1
MGRVARNQRFARTARVSIFQWSEERWGGACCIVQIFMLCGFKNRSLEVMTWSNRRTDAFAPTNKERERAPVAVPWILLLGRDLASAHSRCGTALVRSVNK